MKRFPAGTSADDVQVRMVMDQRGKSTSDVVSLKLAIQTAVENDRDLVGIAIDQDVPVVRVVALSSLEYQSRKQKPAATALPLKEFQIKAAIAENDLRRKVDQMIGYLAKGHKAKVRIRATRRVLYHNPTAVSDTLEKVMQLVKDEEAGEIFKAPEFNAQRSQVQVMLHAPGKK